VQITLDAHLRAACAALAASRWPEREQALRPFKPHRAAVRAARELAALRDHPAVGQMQAAAGERGHGLAEAFGQALDPASALAGALADFSASPPVAALRAENQPGWEQAAGDLSAVLAPAPLDEFLAAIFGPPPPALTLFPNLLFPGDRTVAVRAPEGWFVLLPPPRAWGASPPWRYAERPDEVLAEVCRAAAGALYAVRAGAQAAAAGVVGRGAAVNFLRQALDEAAARSYQMMETRAGYPDLPAVAEALAGHLLAVRAGQASDLDRRLSTALPSP